MRKHSGTLVAILVYLALALYTNRAALTAPFETLPAPKRHVGGAVAYLYRADQSFVVGNIARTSRAFVVAPWQLGASGLCAPMNRPHTLGEHMFGEGLLGALPFLLTGDPIFTFNAVVVLSTWISAMAMYAFAFYWTGSAPAALIAGLLFAFHPQRLNNPAHLFGFANAWTALALLAAHRLFTRRRWRDATLLALCLCLQLLESFYQVLALTIVGGTYGLFLAVQNRGSIATWAPKVCAVAIVSAAAAWLVLGPYLDTQAAWGLLEGRQRLLAAAPNYLPGRRASPGWIAFVLATIGLLDRVRGRRPHNPEGDDPRVPLAFAGFLLFWCSVKWLPIPGVGSLPGLSRILGDFVPGLGAVRVLAALEFGVWLLFAFFSAYGIVALLERLPRRARPMAVALLAAAVILQTFQPTLARFSFGTIADLEPYRARPPEAEVAQVAKLPAGAVLDLPLDFRKERLRLMPGYLLTAGYHGNPVAACYNSFLSDVQREVQRLAELLPDRRAAVALSALGFRSIRRHHGEPSLHPDIDEVLEDDAYMTLIDETPEVDLYLLKPHPTTEAFASIRDTEAPAIRVALERPRDAVRFRFVAPEDASFRHPDPIEPSDVLLRWHDAAGAVAQESQGKLLLPVALAPRERAERELVVDLPRTPGSYRADLSRAAEPDVVLASRRVTVR